MNAISVIMPLYNAEKYLPEAMQSVLNQTYKEFELICIDDCSTDRTRSIIEGFREKDARIKMLINEEHSGAALSRNKGLKMAEGEYIVFLDGDDIFEEELLEKASGAMKKYQADLVLFEYMHVPSELIYTKKTIERTNNFREWYCKDPFSMDTFQPREFPWWASSPCNRMTRKSFLEENNLEFQDLPSCNDVYFAQMSLFCAKKIICLDDRRVMVYARDHSGPQRISNQRNFIYSYYAMEKLCSELKKRNMMGKYTPYLYYRLLDYFRFVLRAQKNEEYKKNFYNFLHEKGITNCIEYGKGYYEQIDAYDRKLLDGFQNKAYESKWFDNLDTYFQFYLRENGAVVCDFTKELITQSQKIILWGVGINGKIFLHYLEEHSIKIFGIVDCDKKKHGMVIDGYKIADPEGFVQEVDYIFVTSRELYKEVTEALKSTKTKVVNLLEMITERKGDA